MIDCANGAAYKVAPTVLWELGADVIAIANEPNGTNINDNCSAWPSACATRWGASGAHQHALDGDAGPRDRGR